MSFSQNLVDVNAKQGRFFRRVTTQSLKNSFECDLDNGGEFWMFLHSIQSPPISLLETRSTCVVQNVQNELTRSTDSNISTAHSFLLSASRCTYDAYCFSDKMSKLL